MTLPDILDHQRAKAAAAFISDKLKNMSTKERNEFRTVVLKAGTAIRQTGLLQFTAFGQTKERGYPQLLNALFQWLTTSPATTALFKHIDRNAEEVAADEIIWGGTVTISFMQKLLQRNSREIAAMEVETTAFVTWLKRLTVGFCEEKERNSGKNDPTGSPSPLEGQEQ